jgi:hypothetical protein
MVEWPAQKMRKARVVNNADNVSRNPANRHSLISPHRDTWLSLCEHTKRQSQRSVVKKVTPTFSGSATTTNVSFVTPQT